MWSNYTRRKITSQQIKTNENDKKMSIYLGEDYVYLLIPSSVRKKAIESERKREKLRDLDEE